MPRKVAAAKTPVKMTEKTNTKLEKATTKTNNSKLGKATTEPKATNSKREKAAAEAKKTNSKPAKAATKTKETNPKAAVAEPTKATALMTSKAPLPSTTNSDTKSAKATLLIGGHVHGGIKKAVSRAEEITANTLQIFLGSPQMWASPSPTVAEITSFKTGIKEKKLGPVFVHGNYLVNLATADATNLRKSLENMHNGLRLADTVGASGLIFHPGSSGQGPYEEALIRLVAALKVILDGYNGKCRLLLEVCAGSGNTIGSAFSQFKDILEALDYDERLGVCWDTCHLYSAGYDIATDKGFEATTDEFEELVGFEWLYAIHANDSKTPFNSRRDRHENIGEGTIGREAFHRMLHHPKLRTLPWILEVPGFEKKGPDKKNIDLLKELAR